MSIGTIKFARFFDVDEHIGEVFSIAVREPKGFEFPKFESFVPPEEIVWSFKDGKITWDEYQERYFDVLDEREAEISEDLGELIKDGESVTLCCWEKDPDQCHRSLVAIWLRSKGVSVEIT